MPNTKIFISHSARDDAYACRVRDAVSRKLQAKGFEVLLDVERLDPGDEWRAKLHQWLAICHGAVILFSRQALESDWVRKETTILTWRWAQNPKLKLVPALLGSTRPQDTGIGDFRPLQVEEIQFARLDSVEETEANAERLSKLIVERFAEFTVCDADRDVRWWVQDIATFLARADRVHRERAREILRIHDDDWLPYQEQEQYQLELLAYQFLTTNLKCALRAIEKLKVSMPSEYMKRLVDLVASVWVDQAAARNILPVTILPEDHRCLAINAKRVQTGEAYVRRATCCATGVDLIQANAIAGENGVQEILDSYRKAFRKAFNIDDRPDSYIEEILEQLDDRKVFILVKNEALTPEILVDVLKGLRDQYRKPTLVLLSGDDLCEREALELPALELIRPELRRGEETSADAIVCLMRGLCL